jgi:glycosyltransferase involved in cell wall biosynthesis
MKIGNVLNEFTMPGGEAAVARAIADKLGAARFEKSSQEWVGVRGIRRFELVAKSFHNWEVLREFRRWVDENQPDVILFHNIFPVLSPAIVKEAKRLGIKTVLYLHSYRYLCTNGFFLNHGALCERCIHGNFWPAALTACWRDSHLLSAWYGAILATLRPRGFFESVDRFIAVSDFVRGKYIEAGVPSERISTLHNFFEYKNHHPSSEDDGYILFMGRLSTEKGIMTLLEAARRLPDIPFRVAGDGPLMETAKTFLKKHSLKNVELPGFVEGNFRKELYSKARFVVVPSEWNDCFPTVVPEAYSFGKPILASAMGGLLEMVEKGNTGELFKCGDAAALTEAIRRMFEDRKRTAAWGRNARAWVENHCDPDIWMEKMKEILISLI